MEKNPLKILYYSRKKLFPDIVWMLFYVFVLFLLVLTFVIPDRILFMNYSVFDTWQFLAVSLSALTFILSMFMFGRQVYTPQDFANLYLDNKFVYYGYLSDYLFPSLLWIIVAILSVCKLVIVVSISEWLLNLLRICFLSIVLLAIISTITLVIHNMNRTSNKIVLESSKLKRNK